MALNTFLGRALMDPATGLPNVPYFSLIRDWEEQRARRRKYAVRVVSVWVEGGSDRVRRALSWHLCQELRSSDLIASEGRDLFRILLTSPDAENVTAVKNRVSELIETLNRRADANPPLRCRLEVEPEAPEPEHHGPCGPCPEPAPDDSIERA
jgi:GGDEF domain-containing protein